VANTNLTLVSDIVSDLEVLVTPVDKHTKIYPVVWMGMVLVRKLCTIRCEWCVSTSDRDLVLAILAEYLLAGLYISSVVVTFDAKRLVNTFIDPGLIFACSHCV
jgi:hypothetical protein